MKKILLFLFLNSLAYSQDLYDWPVTRIIDGDTVQVNVNFLPKELGDRLYIRVWGVDTPEKGWRAKSQYENELGLKAFEFTKQKIAQAKEIKILVIMWDKFGGRILGDIIIDGVSLRQLLLDNGYAREYYGTKKEEWN
jgi:endonuclease YncB( thermonuclease family)